MKNQLSKWIVMILLSIATNVVAQTTFNCPPDITVNIPSSQTSIAVNWNPPTINSDCTISEDPCNQITSEFYEMGTFQNKRIFYSKKGNYTWDEAKAKAASYGGTLVTIQSKKKNKFIAKKMKGKNAWIGYQDENEDDIWEWDDGTISDYSNWARHEPNNYGYWFWIAANHAIINKWNKHWYDQSKFESHYFIMETDCSPTQRPGETKIEQVTGLESGSLFTAGLYNISYRVKNECGYSGSCSFTITVNPPTPTTQLDPNLQPKFVNQLTIPPVLSPTHGNKYIVDIEQFNHDAGIINPTTGEPLTTKMWGYNGQFPGPTFEVQANHPIKVLWRNKLLQNGKVLPHILPVDESIHWARPNNYPNCGVPTVTHLHGGHTEAASDGYPDAWFTPDFKQKGNQFAKKTYRYDNTQESTLLWYHDHAVGITRLNVYAGLAGAYIVRDKWEKKLNLPSGNYEIPLIISDKSFNSDGSLYYPSAPEAPNHPTPSILPEMYGDMILVNGKTWPVLEVEPRKYRFRLLNASDSRFYHFTLSNGMPFTIIGSDGGFIDHPNNQTDLLVAPAERYDIIIDFSNPAYQNQTIIMQNDANSPYPFGDPVDAANAGQIMAFKVIKPLNGIDHSVIPQNLRRTALPTPAPPVRVRQLTLNEGMDAIGRLKPILGTVEDGILNWTDPITENPQVNEPEIWEIINTTPDAHPIHLHQIFFQVLDHQPFDVAAYDGTAASIVRIGQPIVETKEFKDTYIVKPGEIARFAVTFDLEGLYVWHCHILSHEDYDMMRPLYVGSCNEPTNTPTPLTFMHCDPTFGTIGDYVWRDGNGNGIQDPWEYGLSDLSVKLLDCNNNLVDQTWTDYDGYYSFQDVEPGNYKIKVSSIWGYFVSPKHSGSDPMVDSDLNYNYKTDCFSLSAGQDKSDIDLGLAPYFPWFRQAQILNLTLESNKLVSMLTWETNTSEFNDYFLVQRSTSGYNYETIATIDNTNESIYHYEDNHPKEGVNFYRIIAVTTKGNEIHSNSLFAQFYKRDQLRVFPNPASDYILMDLLSYKNQSIDIKFINVIGQTVKDLKMEINSDELTRIDIKSIEKGLYHIQIMDQNGEITTKKLIIER